MWCKLDYKANNQDRVFYFDDEIYKTEEEQSNALNLSDMSLGVMSMNRAFCISKSIDNCFVEMFNITHEEAVIQGNEECLDQLIMNNVRFN